MAASLSGFKVDWLDGVRLESLSQKALPKGNQNLHLNRMHNERRRRLGREDQKLVHQIRTRSPQNTRKQRSVMRVYLRESTGMFSGGTCIIGPSENETHFFAVPHDPTVASVKQRTDTEGIPDKRKNDFPVDSTRCIYHAENGCCLYGYAVCNRGSKRIVAALPVDYLGISVDNSLSHICGGGNGRRRIYCYSSLLALLGATGAQNLSLKTQILRVAMPISYMKRGDGM
ncbi:hypothetical protein N7486_009941 [Penicillium sp. IBT 16267x]|nr:hypothetical protein N7486_009941 [Penicillium sp. IBT 16267x]